VEAAALSILYMDGVLPLHTKNKGTLDRVLFFVYNCFVAFEIKFYEPYED